MKLAKHVITILGALSFLSYVTQDATAESKVVRESTKVLGRNTSITQTLSRPTEGQGARYRVDGEVLGRSVELLDASLKVQYESGGGSGVMPITTGIAEFEVGGKTIFSGSRSVRDGKVSFERQIPPTEQSRSLFHYSLGPVSVGLNAKVRYEGKLRAQASYTFEDGIDRPKGEAFVESDAGVVGTLDGSANLALVRGGVGGSLSLFEGVARVKSTVDPRKSLVPTLSYGGKASLFAGNGFAYLDTYRVLRGEWKRQRTWSLFQWKGRCWSLGEESCQ
jgi:hypothetical protein